MSDEQTQLDRIERKVNRLVTLQDIVIYALLGMIVSWIMTFVRQWFITP